MDFLCITNLKTWEDKSRERITNNPIIKAKLHVNCDYNVSNIYTTLYTTTTIAIGKRLVNKK